MVLLLNAVALAFWRRDDFSHARLGLLAVAVLVAWTGFALWAYADHRRRVPVLLVADLTVALGLMLASPLLKEWEGGVRATIPGFWVAGAMIAWAIHWRWQGGLVAATLVCGTDLFIRQELTQGNYGNIFLLMIAGPIVGYMCGSLQQMAAQRDRAERAAAVAAERARLARAVHDGVLQVLALVQRRGAELGGEAATLGRLAGEQEVALRSVIRQQDSLTEPAGGGVTDLAAALERCGAGRSLRVSVATPGTSVLTPTRVAHELLAVVGACLDNVETHVGRTARAWVLLEELTGSTVVSVRDEGPGIPDGRLGQAAAAGRLGVAESIRGRIADLGGTASLTTGSFGTEWEFAVPR